MASSLDKLEFNLCGTSEIQCDECGGDMELINISDKYTALLRCERCKIINISDKYTALLRRERCKIGKTKDLDESLLKNNFNLTSRFCRCDENFCLMIRKVLYPSEYINGWKKFGETSLPPKNAYEGYHRSRL